MQEEFKIVITGDSIINRRILTCREDRFHSLIKIIQDADVGYTHQKLKDVIEKDYARNGEIIRKAKLGK